MKAVPVLLKRVKSTRTILDKRVRDGSLGRKLDPLTQALNKIEDVFMEVKKNQDQLLDTLHEVDGHLRNVRNVGNVDSTSLDDFCKRIEACASKLLPMGASKSESREIVKSPSHDPSSIQHNNNHLPLPQPQRIKTPKLLELILNQQGWLFSLTLFPENDAFNTRQTIYWWIGRGFVFKEGEKTAEEVGEEVIHQLLTLDVIVPYGNGKCPLFDKFKINPHIRPQLENHVLKEKQPHLGHYVQQKKRLEDHPDHIDCLVLEQRKVMLGDGDGLKPDNSISVICNAGTSYLNFGSQWMDKLKVLEVLQLGRWRDSPSHHIEVGSQEFLKDLGHLKELRYLSLRGISRISKLPPFIANHESLEILDLKACHNLETLPDDISSMKSLTHLILSQCYLLDSMPKGIDKLTQLQVLKGFVLGNSRKTPCTISDLANLKVLRRLSIRIGSEADIKDGEFENLKEFPSLKHLKISWADERYSDIKIIFPKSLKKLHIECFPGKTIPEWLKPSNLPDGLKLPHTSPESLKHSSLPQKFKELKITAGKLVRMNPDDDMNKWSMEIVRLRYLEHLKVELTDLEELFPLLSCITNLKKLRRRSIHIGSEAVIKDGDFESLREFSALEHLKISWGASQIILPARLKKLHLQGFRGQRIPEWLKPSKLSSRFKELNITGGKLEKNTKQWDMNIVRLKYLKHLEVDLTNLH